MSNLKLNQLEMLVAVVDNGGFGAAAAALDCTQSRVSHAITELENVLGVRLLSRSRSGCVATDAGQRVVQQARDVLQLTHRMVEGANEDAALAGRVRVACFRSVATHLLPNAIAALALEHPAIRVDIDDAFQERDDVTRAVLEGRAEIGIAQLPVPASLLAYPFVSDAYVLVTPAALQLRAPVTWAQLAALPYIQLDCPGALAVLALCRAAGFDAPLTRTLATDTSIAAMVRLGVGYSILPRLAVFPEPDGVRIVDLPISAPRRFALVVRPDTARDKVVQAVTRFIRNKRIVSRSDVFKAALVAW